MRLMADRVNTNNTIFWTTLIFTMPAALAYACAVGLRDGADLFLPGLWFVYSASRVIAMMGATLSVGISAVCVARHVITGKGLLIAGTSVAGTLFLLWYSAHVAAIVR